MKPVLLVDFGSTYTKAVVVDIDSETVLATESSYTTVETDINIGFNNALNKIEQKIGNLKYEKTMASSSAAGGLRMISCGLVPDLTTKAAKMACLGAGAKLIASYSYELTDEDIEQIDNLKPDILLLSGGIDGGNTQNIIHNAGMLSKLSCNFPIIVAGNRNAAKQCLKLLDNKTAILSENVMPKFNELNIEPVQKLIREVFLQKITSAKGADKAASILKSVLMPTPVALLSAMKLLANGTKKQSGVGELIGVDLGGATTDMYSIAKGEPSNPATVLKGLPEPYAKRTVEGDIGMRYSIEGIVDATGLENLAELAQLGEETAKDIIDYLINNTETLPQTEEHKMIDYALAYSAIETASIRHAGTLEVVYTPMGETFVQTGKDLTQIKHMVLTGGAVVYADNVYEIAKGAFYNIKEPMSLRPKSASIMVDKKYILFSMGLLSEKYPETALNIIKKELFLVEPT